MAQLLVEGRCDGKVLRVSIIFSIENPENLEKKKSFSDLPQPVQDKAWQLIGRFAKGRRSGAANCEEAASFHLGGAQRSALADEDWESNAVTVRVLQS